jgi:Flp pilus assembly protein TadG
VRAPASGRARDGGAGWVRGEAGQSLVETALMLPALLLFLVIVVDAARAFDALIVLTNAVREGARYASLEPSPDVAAIRLLVAQDVQGSGTNITHMETFTTTNVAMEEGTSTVSGQETGIVTVTATYEFPLWFGGLVGVPTLELEKSAVMPRDQTVVP